MKGYKWLTHDRRRFFDGKVVEFGVNTEEGPADGTICRSGGLHILTTPILRTVFARGSKINPNYVEIACYQVNYLKRDVLGQDRGKLRVRSFQLLKKAPVRLEYPSTSTTDTSTSTAGLSVWVYLYA